MLRICLTIAKGLSMMKVVSPKLTRGYVRALRQAAFAVLLSLFASQSFAQRSAEGPFAALLGSWSGAGTIALSNGTKERIRCRAAYRLGNRSVDLLLGLGCASDSYKFELQSAIAYRGQSISGTWFESTREVGGAITGRVVGSQINARAEGQAFTAILALNTRGNRQSISIQSPGSEMSEVAITLTRGSR
jgi:hypothetical protein